MFVSEQKDESDTFVRGLLQEGVIQMTTTTIYVHRITTTTAKKKKKVSTTTTTATTTTILVCPFECCPGNFFLELKCMAGTVCQNYTCVQVCENECCNTPGYEIVECSFPLKCISNKCIKTPCRYECCSGEGRYHTKDCGSGYRCINNLCFKNDADSDGLPDDKEADLKTSKLMKDTDSDGWNDYKEIYHTKTNPKRSNTDDDRYIDSKDISPLVTNTAVIDINILNFKQEFDNNIIQDLKKYYTWSWGTVDPKSNLVNISANIQVINSGTDYTSYIKYKIALNHTCILYITNASIPTATYLQFNNTLENVGAGRTGILENGSKYSTFFRKTFYVEDFPGVLLRNITFCRNQFFNLSIYNLEYEQF